MFDTDTLLTDCLAAVRGEADGRVAVKDVLTRVLDDADAVAGALGRDEGGLDLLYVSPELTVLNAIWAPGMGLYPHDHRMWAVIGIYGGVEDNALYRRGPDGIVASGGRTLRVGDVLSLGSQAIHSVSNPERRFTGAIHVYGGDFVAQPRSQWDPETLVEQAYDLEQVRRLFAEANAAWAAEVDRDLDEHVG